MPRKRDCAPPVSMSRASVANDSLRRRDTSRDGVGTAGAPGWNSSVYAPASLADRCVVEVERIGRLENPVADE